MLECLIEDVAPKRAVLLGHSMGGMVALEAWRLYSHRIAGLILSCTSPAFGKPDGAWQQAFLHQRLDPLDEGRSMANLAPGLVRGMVAPDANPVGIGFAVRVMSGAARHLSRRAGAHELRSSRAASHFGPDLGARRRGGLTPAAVVLKMAEKYGAIYECLPQSGISPA